MRLRYLVTCVCPLALIALADSPVKASATAQGVECSIVGTVSMYDDDVTVRIVAAFVPGKGWLESEEAVGLLHEGDRLSLHALEQGLLGEVALTSEGELASEKPVAGGAVWGLSYDARLQTKPEMESRYEAATRLRRTGPLWWPPTLLASSKGPTTPGKWLTAVSLPGPLDKCGPHYTAVADWLRSLGASESAIRGLEIIQAVKADVDGDGQDEVFLSVHGPGIWAYTEGGRSNAEHFSYLVMQRTREGIPGIGTTVLDDRAWRSLWVCGLQDLDGDGWAEVVTRGQGLDYGGAQLFHWDGHQFVEIDGWGAGA